MFIAGLVAIDMLFSLLPVKDGNIFSKIALQKIDVAHNNLIKSTEVFDVLVFGSSHAEFGVDPAVLTGEFGKKTFNLAYGGGSASGDQLRILQRYLKSKPAPKVIIYGIDVFFMNFKAYKDGKMEELLFEGKKGHQRQDWKDQINTVPFLSRAYRYGRYLFSEASFLRKYEGYEITDLGFVKGYGILNPEFVRYRHVDFQPDPEGEDALREIVKLCRQNDIKLFFVQLPEHASALRYDKKYRHFDLWIRIFCKKAGVPYFNLNSPEEFPVDNDNYYFDSDHLNWEGSQLASHKIAQWIYSFAKVSRQK